MLHKLSAISLALLSLAVEAQTTQTTITVDPKNGEQVKIFRRATSTSKQIYLTVNKNTVVTLKAIEPPTDHHSGILNIDFSQIGTPFPGVSTPLLTPAKGDGSDIPPLSPGKEDGAFRTVCTWVSMQWDDPIVYPGRAGFAHSHTFFGNTAIDANTTPENIRSKGNASCRGGTINLSGYWVATLVDESLRAVPPQSVVVYYKSGWQPWLQEPVPPQVLPTGLRMIVGSSTAQVPQVNEVPELGPHTFWQCTDSLDQQMTGNEAGIPKECKTGQVLKLRVDFRQCWNGQLDSPDHKSHVVDPTYSNGDGINPAGFRCPVTHRAGLLPVISFNVRWPITGDPSKYRISSDTYDRSLPGGYSAHGDWMNGWDPEISKTWMDNCIIIRRDCGSFNLGDGRGGIEFGGN